MFNILAHGVEDFAIEGARVVDLFAGTGAMGIEAISRGAGYCLFVEESADARALIRRNVEAFHLQGVTRIFRRDATALGPAGNMDRFSLAFLDPPYGKGLGARALAALVAGRWLEPGAVVVIEEAAREAVAFPPEIVEFDERRYGDTAIRIARYTAAASV